jgi:hypothetical protein
MTARLVNADGVVVIEIRSVFVTWEEMGIKNNDDRLAAQRRWPEIQDWLDSRCERTFNPGGLGIWFLDPNDAMIFKLTWAGLII